jgi:hypothetical protein
MRMLQRDDPDHQRIRNLIQKAFLRTSVDRWSNAIVQRIQSLLQVGMQARQMDFIRDFAVLLPVLVTSEIVGIPADDQNRVKQWCDDFALVATNFYANISVAQLERGRRSTEAFRTYLSAQVDEVHRAPRDDLLSALVHAEEEGARLTFRSPRYAAGLSRASTRRTCNTRRPSWSRSGKLWVVRHRECSRRHSGNDHTAQSSGSSGVRIGLIITSTSAACPS